MFSISTGRRMFAGAGLALGLVTGAVALAGPASAATVTAQLDSGRILVNGSSADDGIEIDLNAAGTVVTISNTLGSVAAGPGCAQAGGTARCPAGGIDRVDVFAGDGIDAIRNNTKLPSTLSGDNGFDNVSGGSGADILFGGFGDDKLNGGLGNDRLSGGIGTDTLNGGADTDRCDGEIESNCEL
ncbi:calcium-binding protein [Nonomuraea sp. NPDC047897]|jgi:Ca2+-binding RTX toxin-like protein|uniref:calcium-binding protein n=1 Tax=Nonomuraea sp. NPDC047897 TaxID=3364346 RepID=UPI00371CF774